MQYGTEARMPWFPAIELPEATTQEDMAADRYAAIRNTSHQHPDHDTTVWPIKEPPQ
jgi:hypothetical protein